MKTVRMTLFAVALLAALAITPAYALEYSVGGPSAGEFGTPTSDTMVYVAENPAALDKSKSTALIPPGFGTPTSYLPGSGELLTPNLAGNTGSLSVVMPDLGGVTMLAPVVVETPAVSYPVTAYTAVTSDLYYSGSYLAILQIPRLGVNVKVYEGTDSAQLAKGAGHFPGTSIWDGNVAVAGHNRGANCYFGDIHKLTQGDTITLTTKLGKRTYAVTSVFKVEETDSSMLAASVDNCITLYTCVRDQSAYRWCVRAVEI